MADRCQLNKFVYTVTSLDFSSPKQIFASLAMATEDSELRELEELKATLVQRIYQLRDALKSAERSGARSRRVPVNDFPNFFNDPNASKAPNDSNVDKVSARLCEASQSCLGLQFRDVQKNWLHDNIYRYNAHVITKAIKFSLEFTVNVKDTTEYEIQDINCHFANIDKSYLQEITPWIERFTKDKDFSYLMSAISDYSEQSIIRAKILSSMNSKGYLTLAKCHEDGGGILIYLHPPEAKDQVFFKFQWFTKFVDKTWRIEHIFAIDPIQADEEFVKENKELLQSFCRIGLRQKDLEELWNKLCLIIDNNK